MPKILITGCSSGFGLAIAQKFLNAGWDVVATMRTPRNNLLLSDGRLEILPLDITSADSIAKAVEAAGTIDALVNNAGVGMLNVLEGSEMSKVRELFETNVFGAMAMTKAVLPQMRSRRSGVIVNVSSTVTIRPLPALSVYSASRRPSTHLRRASRSKRLCSESAPNLFCLARRRRPASARMLSRAWAWRFPSHIPPSSTTT